MGEMIPQLPKRHCGLRALHPLHTNSPADSYCDGIGPVGPFVELTIRVPLTGFLDMEDEPHDVVLSCIMEEFGAYTWDNIDSPDTRLALRVRAGGKDEVYPLTCDENGHVAVKR